MKKQAPDRDSDDLPKLGSSATKGQLGEALVEVAMLELHQLYERRSGLDFGVDGVIELTTSGVITQATGRQIGVQVKRGLSVIKKTRFGFTYYCTDAHANYWLKHSLPIIVVHSDPETGQLRWRHVSVDTLRHTGNGYAIDLPPESELRNSLDDLRKLAYGWKLIKTSSTRTLVLPYSEQHGVRTSDPELGLVALEFSRAALRGVNCQLLIEVEEEPNILAIIDSIRDVAEPTAQERRDAVVCEDVLHRIRKQADKLQRALFQMLTQRSLAEAFGYRDELLAEAIRRLAGPYPQLRELGNIALDAWPKYGWDQAIIKFDIPEEVLDEYYAQQSINRIAMKMGDAGGCLVGDLHSDVVATRFMPILAKYLIAFAETKSLRDDEALEAIGVQPTMWLMGLA